ncbi:fungal specific transcription factor, putative [Talaromyces stipitatus ATCC 10500]|uniref:Fungal specific transcription factor, putative n=1 Tax=Talaromyces stipitatus (strain ATCC 10500 / CBS 375.48 / QM 6759 / NRRL 1006) TaxID=441959 RepID=B8MRV1_TALSN|nr:fungal specific transcription factor, putative [Talaromyces stipitatus ATCC 10500]EED13285.1 fungal specific transcription factor, putative [Talaromyces stipitatus ATCC 10500]
MAIITAKLIGFSPDGSELDTRIDHLLSSNHLELDMMGDMPTLNELRKAYLLAFYEFHQFPGNQSWMRIGKLTRIAYRVGLDKLERLPTLYPDWASISQADLQEWRSLWWCIYKIDSYMNFASGTPYLIDRDFTNTGLTMSQQFLLSANEGVNGPQPVYLPPSSRGLWEVLPALGSDPDTFLANIHIITVTVVRDIASVGRILVLHLDGDILPPFSEIERQLSALRLALPPGWLNPDRNAFAGESQGDHHARLVTIFQLSFAQLYLAMLSCRGKEDHDWARSWQKVLENCQDIARAAAQWDSSFCVKVDPAITFILLPTLIFLELHKATNVSSSAFNFQASIEHDQTIVRLLLDQFAKIWTLPRLLVFWGLANTCAQCHLKVSVNHSPAYLVHYLTGKSTPFS